MERSQDFLEDFLKGQIFPSELGPNSFTSGKMWTMEVHKRTPPPKQSRIDVNVALNGRAVLGGHSIEKGQLEFCLVKSLEFVPKISYTHRNQNGISSWFSSQNLSQNFSIELCPCFLLASVDSFMYFLKHMGRKPRKMGMSPVNAMAIPLTTASSIVEWKYYIKTELSECLFGTGCSNSLSLYIPWPGNFHIWHPR